jgi:hypothetical protein
MRRILCPLVVIGLVAAVPAARAGDKAAEPTVVIRVNSLNTVLKDLKVLATLLGREKEAQSIQDLIKAKVGAKGLQGIDLNRPAGAYVRFGEDITDINGAVLVPVADTQNFLTLLQGLQGLTLNPNKGKDDIYTLTVTLQNGQNIDLYMRFANKYAYFSAVNTDYLSDKNLLDPAKVLAGSADSLLSVAIRIDQVPDLFKTLAIDQFEKNVQTLQDNALPGETEGQKEFRIATVKQVTKSASDVLRQGQRATIDVSMNKDKNDLSVRLSLSAKPGTELATTIANSGKYQSAFAALLPNNAAFRGSIGVHFPPEMHKTFAKAIEDSAHKALADLPSDAKRKQAQALVDSIIPTIKSGQLDAFFGMAGPVDKHYTLVAAVKLADGDHVGTVIHDLLEGELKTMPAAQREKIQLDVATVGGVKIHKLELPPDPKTNKVLEGLPGDPNLYVAFRKDAAFLAIGPQSLATLKQAIGSQQTGTVPVFLFDFNLARMADTIAKTPKQKEAAGKLFIAGKDGRVRLVVNGGDAMTLRLDVALNVLEFFANLKKE